MTANSREAAERHRDAQVLAAAKGLTETGQAHFGPSALLAWLLEAEEPLWPWEVRQALARLERAGDLQLDPLKASWRLAQD